MIDVLINNERYIKASDAIKSNTIGIGITTHNRNILVEQTVNRIRQLTPDAKVVVVDDCSQQNVIIDGVQVYRFNQNVGIAKAKNKCLEMLSDCDHIFLFDDDTYPIKEGWYEPYIASPEHHMMYLFTAWASGEPVGDDAIVYQDDLVKAHHHARGCMMYIDSLALATVGGMDERFGIAMNEHLDWSMRIHNAGLTTFCYMDVVDSEQLIHSMDQHREVRTSIENRQALKVSNEHLLQESTTSAAYMPYGKDVVVACYFASVNDPQRNVEWPNDENAINRLRQSVEAHGLEFVLIHNCFDLPNKVTISGSPYFERWLKEWQYLRDRRDIRNVFVVDATDVDMLNNPFPFIENGVLYVGDEPTTVGCEWMRREYTEYSVRTFIENSPEHTLLNCGVVGGNRQLVMDLCREIYLYHFRTPQDKTEMGIFNKLLYTRYDGRFEFGRHVTTVFKQFEQSSNAWFRHK